VTSQDPSAGSSPCPLLVAECQGHVPLNWNCQLKVKIYPYTHEDTGSIPTSQHSFDRSCHGHRGNSKSPDWNDHWHMPSEPSSSRCVRHGCPLMPSLAHDLVNFHSDVKYFHATAGLTPWTPTCDECLGPRCPSRCLEGIRVTRSVTRDSSCEPPNLRQSAKPWESICP
jgi:hypothetical protein